MASRSQRLLRQRPQSEAIAAKAAVRDYCGKGRSQRLPLGLGSTKPTRYAVKC